MMDDNKRWFNELLEQFETEKIEYDVFIEELSQYSQGQIEAIGVTTYYKWLTIKRDYLYMKRFNQNEGQISLF